MKLGELITIKHGFAFPGSNISKEQVGDILVTPGNFSIGGGFKSDKFKYFDGEFPSSYVLSKGDFIVTMTDLSRDMDTLGYPALVPDAPHGFRFLHNQRVGLVEIINPIVDRTWLYYRMMARDYRHSVTSSSTGTTVHHTSPTRILSFELEIPSLETQKEIARILKLLDDKIESNQRIIDVLPQLIAAKIQLALEGTQAPIDASVATLARFINGGAYTKGASGTGRMVVRIAELNSGPGASTVYNDIDVPEDKTVRAGGILMSWSGSLDVYRWYRDEAIVNQHIFKVIPEGYPDWYVFDRLKAAIGIFQGIAKDKATTMGHIKRGDLDSALVPMLSDDVIAELDQELGAMWQRLLMLEAECERLRKLRDLLLPELLSGRLAPEDIPALVNSGEVAHA